MRKISVIMPCLILDEELLVQAQQAISSLRASADNLELVVTDDGSKVGSDFLAREADIYIRNEKNRGFGPACNQATEKATGDFLALSCLDVDVIRGSFNNLVEDHGLEKEEKVIFPSFINKNEFYEKGREWNSETDGACYIMPISLYKKHGLYDERYTQGYFEDTDLWKRLRSVNISLLRSGSMLVNHLEGTTQKKLGNRDEIFEENRKRYIEKWGEEPVWTG